MERDVNAPLDELNDGFEEIEDLRATLSDRVLGCVTHKQELSPFICW